MIAKARESAEAFIDGSAVVPSHKDPATKKQTVGGWGGIIVYPSMLRRDMIFGWKNETDSNRMELTAAIEVFREIPRGMEIHLARIANWYSMPSRLRSISTSGINGRSFTESP